MPQFIALRVRYETLRVSFGSVERRKSGRKWFAGNKRFGRTFGDIGASHIDPGSRPARRGMRQPGHGVRALLQREPCTFELLVDAIGVLVVPLLEQDK